MAQTEQEGTTLQLPAPNLPCCQWTYNVCVIWRVTVWSVAPICGPGVLVLQVVANDVEYSQVQTEVLELCRERVTLHVSSSAAFFLYVTRHLPAPPTSAPKRHGFWLWLSWRLWRWMNKLLGEIFEYSSCPFQVRDGQLIDLIPGERLHLGLCMRDRNE